MDSITIRLEEPRDYRAVEELVRAAFNNPDRIDRSKIDCPMEHHMVHKLRQRDGVMSLNFVAEAGGRIVGHVIYSDAHILTPDGTTVPVLDMGPLSVLPEVQRMGVGSALMRYSIEQARAQGYGAILFYGHASYYPRFGFVSARTYLGDTVNEYCFAMELKEGYLNGVTGQFVEPDIYHDDLNREQAKAFDVAFRARADDAANDVPVQR